MNKMIAGTVSLRGVIYVAKSLVLLQTLMDEDDLLFPPVLPNKMVAELVQANYPVSNLDSSSIKLLRGYEDRNYYLQECSMKNGNGKDEEYIFKLMNKKDSQFPEFFDALSKLMFFINAEGLTCSLPVQPTTVPDGTFIIPLKRSFLLQTDIGKDCIYVGILLTYLPGKTMSEIERSPKLLYNAGKFVGKLITSLQVQKVIFGKTNCIDTLKLREGNIHSV